MTTGRGAGRLPMRRVDYSKSPPALYILSFSALFHRINRAMY
jgi:hypothetical protein